LPQVDSDRFVILRGKAEILPVSPVLAELALRCRQPGATGWIEYFFALREFRWKTPYLVLIGDARLDRRPDPAKLRAEDLSAAVLLFEYRILGLGTGVFATVDSSAFRSVVAPAAQRAAAAALASQVLLRRVAQVVIATYDDAARRLPGAALVEAAAFPYRCAILRRSVAKTLELEDTYEATLAKLGKATRFNLGYYRRRWLAKMPCTFVPDARGLLNERELHIVNANCLNPVPFALFKLQYWAACNLQGGFLLGLRGPSGEWIGLIGGWRQETATVLHWQTNISGYEKASIGTVMRSFFIEHEIARGARTLTFYGGTPHSMQHSFVQDQAVDLVLRRDTLRASLLVLLVRVIARVQSWLGPVNFVAETLRDATLHWEPGVPNFMAEHASHREMRGLPMKVSEVTTTANLTSTNRR
jgi:hypothetical protein